jgi:UDP-N-acetyl-D-mannosaminuronic acid dehydrogenase
MNLNDLKLKVNEKQAKIAVIGLGYVGLPVACTFASVGFHVTGMEIRQERVEKINNGINPIEGEEPGLSELLAKVVKNGYFSATTDYEKLRNVDIVLIDVEQLANLMIDNNVGLSTITEYQLKRIDSDYFENG